MQEELSLREVMKIIWKGKWIIAIITAICIAFSGFASFFLMDPTFEAASTVRIGAEANGQTEGPVISTFSETILSDVSIQNMIEKLALDPTVYSINSIRNNTETVVIEKANVMTFKVKGTDPKTITQLANIMAFELGARVEISERAKTIVEASNRIRNLEQQIQIYNKEIEEVQEQLLITPERLVTKETVSDNPYLQSIIEERLNSAGSQVGQIALEREEINPVHTKLQDRLKELQIGLARLNTEMVTLQQEITKNEQLIAELDTQNYDGMLATTTTNRIMNDFSAVFISPALVPTDRVSPSHTLNLAVGAVVGLFFSLAIVFLRQYWINTEEHQMTQQETV